MSEALGGRRRHCRSARYRLGTQGSGKRDPLRHARRLGSQSQSEFEQLAEKFDSLKVQLLPDGPLPWLARALAATDAVNLLQGEFARTTDFGARWRQWRTAGSAGGGPARRRMSALRRCKSARPSTKRPRSTGKSRASSPPPCPPKSCRIRAARCSRGSIAFTNRERARNTFCAP